MKKPYATDWVETGNPEVIYSPSEGLYWSEKEQKSRDQTSAEWAGWVGVGLQLKRTIAGEDHGNV